MPTSVIDHQVCHPERSEGSRTGAAETGEILHYACKFAPFRMTWEGAVVLWSEPQLVRT